MDKIKQVKEFQNPDGTEFIQMLGAGDSARATISQYGTTDWQHLGTECNSIHAGQLASYQLAAMAQLKQFYPAKLGYKLVREIDKYNAASVLNSLATAWLARQVQAHYQDDTVWATVAGNRQAVREYDGLTQAIDHILYGVPLGTDMAAYATIAANRAEIQSAISHPRWSRVIGMAIKLARQYQMLKEAERKVKAEDREALESGKGGKSDESPNPDKDSKTSTDKPRSEGTTSPDTSDKGEDSSEPDESSGEDNLDLPEDSETEGRDEDSDDEMDSGLDSPKLSSGSASKPSPVPSEPISVKLNYVDDIKPDRTIQKELDSIEHLADKLETKLDWLEAAKHRTESKSLDYVKEALAEKTETRIAHKSSKLDHSSKFLYLKQEEIVLEDNVKFFSGLFEGTGLATSLARTGMVNHNGYLLNYGNTKVFTRPPRTKTDIVIMVDLSGSMQCWCKKHAGSTIYNISNGYLAFQAAGAISAGVGGIATVWGFCSDDDTNYIVPLEPGMQPLCRNRYIIPDGNPDCVALEFLKTQYRNLDSVVAIMISDGRPEGPAPLSGYHLINHTTQLAEEMNSSGMAFRSVLIGSYARRIYPAEQVVRIQSTSDLPNLVNILDGLID